MTSCLMEGKLNTCLWHIHPISIGKEKGSEIKLCCLFTGPSVGMEMGTQNPSTRWVLPDKKTGME